ncbi:MAG: hypothetical protein K0R26_2818 [Bacteroidota bacterium]|jgi:hypothetical protein|nr:hypothetical protein [Bacteroidota bacterium]
MTEELDPKTYPIGKAQNRVFTKEVLYQSILMVESAPLRLRQRIATLNGPELELSYRNGGWSIRQIIHHLADSHMKMWIRFKHTMAENNPTIQPYDQDKWTNSADYQSAPIESSLMIFEGIQSRFSNLLKNMSESDFKRIYTHPEFNKKFTLGEATQLYAWHGLHHVAQIEGVFK